MNKWSKEQQEHSWCHVICQSHGDVKAFTLSDSWGGRADPVRVAFGGSYSDPALVFAGSSLRGLPFHLTPRVSRLLLMFVFVSLLHPPPSVCQHQMNSQTGRLLPHDKVT